MEGLPNPVLLSLRMTLLERIKMETKHLSSKRKFLVHGLLLGTITLLGAAQSISAQWNTASGTNNIYYNGGNVGIGTNSPSDLLHVYKSAASNTQIIVENPSSSNGAQANFRAKNDAGDLSQVGIYGSGNAAYGALGSGESYQYSTKSLTLMAENASGIIKFATGGTAEKMRITASGSLGIGTTTPNTVDTLDLNAFGYKGLHFLNNGGGARVSVTGNGSASNDFVDSNAAANQRWFLLQNIGGKAYYRGVSDAGAVNYELMTFDLSNGRIGIGNTSPGYKLDVGGTINASGVNVSGSPLTSSQWATTGANIGYSAGNVAIGSGTPTTPLHVFGNGTVTGNLTVGGVFAAKYQDVAEWVPSSEELRAGTVVVLDTTKSNQVISSTQSYDPRVAGVISEQPGIALGEGGKDKVLVATTGRVLVKVDASRAAVHIGDLLVTSNVPGAAMKSEPINIGGVQLHRPGTLIGKALEPLEKGSGKILVLLSLQ